VSENILGYYDIHCSAYEVTTGQHQFVSKGRPGWVNLVTTAVWRHTVCLFTPSAR